MTPQNNSPVSNTGTVTLVREAEIRQKQAELIKDRCKGIVMTWNVAGRNREALVFPPTTDLAMKHPLIFAWHGHGGNMNSVAEAMHFQTLWPRRLSFTHRASKRKRRMIPMETPMVGRRRMAKSTIAT